MIQAENNENQATGVFSPFRKRGWIKNVNMIFCHFCSSPCLNWFQVELHWSNRLVLAFVGQRTGKGLSSESQSVVINCCHINNVKGRAYSIGIAIHMNSCASHNGDTPHKEAMGEPGIKDKWN